MRNSSLVKWFRADNLTGLKHTTEAVSFAHELAFRLRAVGQARGWVGERHVPEEAAGQPSRGRHTSENAGMSSE